jgi:hypothetical protein
MMYTSKMLRTYLPLEDQEPIFVCYLVLLMLMLIAANVLFHKSDFNMHRFFADACIVPVDPNNITDKEGLQEYDAPLMM